MQLATRLIAAALPLLAAGSPAELEARQGSGVRITVNLAQRYQVIDGFGFSEAFQRANGIVNLPEPKRQQVLDLLFNTTTGAGFTILRNGIGSSLDSSRDYMNTILPKSPGSPTATPNYVWDGKDSGQLWVSQQAVKYGVKTFYANAWSAPGFMKTNGVDSGGGRLRDEWRKPYAEYLVQYVRFYAQSGVNVTHLGFLNEPDFSTSYASMQMDASAAAAFIRDYLWPAIKAAGLANQLTINCCEGTGWSVAAGYARTLNSLPADIPLIMTGHTYTSGISGPLPTTRKTWETECSDLNSRWNTAWSGGAADGLTWANNIHTGLTTGNCSAYLWWEGTQDRATNNNNNEKLILVDNGNYEVSKRLWAFAQFSRSARPGAVRVGVSGGSGLRLTAFVNVDGSVAVVIINGGGSAQNLSITGALTADQVAAGPATAEMFTTDNTRDMARSAVTVAADGTVSGVSVPGRAMVSVVIRPAAAPATAARRW